MCHHGSTDATPLAFNGTATTRSSGIADGSVSTWSWLSSESETTCSVDRVRTSSQLHIVDAVRAYQAGGRRQSCAD